MPKRIDPLLAFVEAHQEEFFPADEAEISKSILSALKGKVADAVREPEASRMFHNPQAGDKFTHATTGLGYTVTGTKKNRGGATTHVSYKPDMDLNGDGKRREYTVPHSEYKGWLSAGVYKPVLSKKKSVEQDGDMEKSIKRPGSRGGRGYYAEDGWRYGERTSPTQKVANTRPWEDPGAGGWNEPMAPKDTLRNAKDKVIARQDAAFAAQAKVDASPAFRMMLPEDRRYYNETGELPKRINDLLQENDKGKIAAAIKAADKHRKEPTYRDPYEEYKSEDEDGDIEKGFGFKEPGKLSNIAESKPAVRPTHESGDFIKSSRGDHYVVHHVEKVGSGYHYFLRHAGKPGDEDNNVRRVTGSHLAKKLSSGEWTKGNDPAAQVHAKKMGIGGKLDNAIGGALSTARSRVGTAKWELKQGHPGLAAHYLHTDNDKSEDGDDDIQKSLNERFIQQGAMVGDEFETVPAAGHSYKSQGAVKEVGKNGMVRIEHAPWGEPVRSEYLHHGELVRSINLGKMTILKGGVLPEEAQYEGPVCRKCGQPESIKLPGSGYCDSCLTPAPPRWW